MTTDNESFSLISLVLGPTYNSHILCCFGMIVDGCHLPFGDEASCIFSAVRFEIEEGLRTVNNEQISGQFPRMTQPRPRGWVLAKQLT